MLCRQDHHGDRTGLCGEDQVRHVVAAKPATVGVDDRSRTGAQLDVTFPQDRAQLLGGEGTRATPALRLMDDVVHELGGEYIARP